ncbi:MAG: regulatory protein RecX [Clostridia bacterium]|nr:regulatory protein RecX [Clostridia bacterium]
MIITSFEERKKSQTALYIDGEYAVTVDTMTFLSTGKKIGSEITDDELYELIEMSKFNRAKEKALYLIEYRSRTKKELYDKLIPLFGESASALAIERLEELGLINDESYAREYADVLLNKKGFSRQRALFELMKKGIDKDLAEEILDESEPDPVEQIKHLLETKFLRRLSNEKDLAKTVNALKSMGYRWSDIQDAMSIIEDVDL